MEFVVLSLPAALVAAAEDLFPMLSFRPVGMAKFFFMTVSGLFVCHMSYTQQLKRTVMRGEEKKYTGKRRRSIGEEQKYTNKRRRSTQAAQQAQAVHGQHPQQVFKDRQRYAQTHE